MLAFLPFREPFARAPPRLPVDVVEFAGAVSLRGGDAAGVGAMVFSLGERTGDRARGGAPTFPCGGGTGSTRTGGVDLPPGARAFTPPGGGRGWTSMDCTGADVAAPSVDAGGLAGRTMLSVDLGSTVAASAFGPGLAHCLTKAAIASASGSML